MWGSVTGGNRKIEWGAEWRKARAKAMDRGKKKLVRRKVC